MDSTLSQTTNVDPAYLYKALSKVDILSLVTRSAPDHRPRTRITKYLNRSKQELLDILLQDNKYWTEELYKIAIHKEEERGRLRREKARRHTEHIRTVRQEHTQETDPNEVFLDLPPNADLMRCYIEAYTATSKAAFEQRICAVCARLRMTRETEFSQMSVMDIPNRHRLRPDTPHPDHVLTQDCLLERQGCHGGGANPLANICKECLNELQVSFELNSAAVADMISGNLMPQKPNILASTLSVTFIGRGKIKDPDSLYMLRVRRDAVGDALRWLQQHNKKYYGDIIIDTDRLNALPPDNIPEAITRGFRYESNESMAEDEYYGYKPDWYFADEANVEAVTSVQDDPNADNTEGADVIPLQYLGVMDNDQSKVCSDELMSWGLNNMVRHADDTRECGYAVRHGAPVNTFGQPRAGEGPADPNRHNVWEAAFPILHPRGLGGIEADRPVQLSLNDHGKWALGYHDGRFRLHHSYIFMLFGMQQRRQGLLSTSIQMNRYDFDDIAHTLSTITPADLRQAAEEECQSSRGYEGYS
ncbi:hypothetical protein FRC07_010054 [Ceratobasidium sp. 392]|nr:hypothetical protein FRC07_010054 [Ceratobasidium sp. 392]